MYKTHKYAEERKCLTLNVVSNTSLSNTPLFTPAKCKIFMHYVYIYYAFPTRFGVPHTIIRENSRAPY